MPTEPDADADADKLVTNERLSRLEAEDMVLREDIDGLREDIDGLRGDVRALSGNFTGLIGEMSARRALAEQLVKGVLAALDKVATALSAVCSNAGHKVLYGIVLLGAVALAGLLGLTIQWGDLAVGPSAQEASP